MQWCQVNPGPESEPFGMHGHRAEQRKRRGWITDFRGKGVVPEGAHVITEFVHPARKLECPSIGLGGLQINEGRQHQAESDLLGGGLITQIRALP